jgi:hypothetical protein
MKRKFSFTASFAVPRTRRVILCGHRADFAFPFKLRETRTEKQNKNKILQTQRKIQDAGSRQLLEIREQLQNLEKMAVRVRQMTKVMEDKLRINRETICSFFTKIREPGISQRRLFHGVSLVG